MSSYSKHNLPTGALKSPQNRCSKNYGAIRWADESAQQPNKSHLPNGTNAEHLPFRVAIGLLLVLACTLYHYAANSLAIVSVAMVASDVLDRGLTDIRLKHLALDPSLRASAAAPGTCPIELARPAQRSGANGSSGELERELDVYTSQVQARLSQGDLINWTIGERAQMVTAISLGKLLCALPMGRLSYAHGNSLTLLLSLLAAALFALLFPLVVRSAPLWFTFLFSLLTGGVAATAECVSYPLAAAWFLADEASTVTGLLHISVVMGTTLTFFVSGELLSYDLPWSWCFYLPGGLLLLVTLGWWIFGADKPEESRFVSRREMALLQFSVSRCSADRTPLLVPQSCVCEPSAAASTSCPARQLVRRPHWRTLLTCPTVWTLTAFNFAHSWDTALKSYWAAFFANILHLDAATTGTFMGLRGLLVLVYTPLFVCSTRRLASHRPFNMSLIAFRRSAALLGSSLLMGLVALLVLLDCSPAAVMVSVMGRPLVTSLNMVSYAQVPLDIAPDDGALIMAFTRLVGFGDVLALPVSSSILSLASESPIGNRYTWRLIWLLGLAISCAACLLFVCFAALRPMSYSRLEPKGVCSSREAEGDATCKIAVRASDDDRQT